MTKRMTFDGSGDSDDLQALFDSIAGTDAAEKPKLEVVEPKAAAPGGDSDELQDLFDAVANEFEGDEPEAAAAVADPEADAAPADAAMEIDALVAEAEAATDHSCDVVYQRLGQMTRKVHNALSELGYDKTLQNAAEVIPDARQRLNYIAQMTEQAASKVLNATDIAKPMQERIESGASELKGQWDKLFANELSADEFKSLAERTRNFLGQTVDDSRGTNGQLTEIMMAQDFQDLTGQVIKRVVEMAQMIESQLLSVLIESAPEDKRPARTADNGLMNGPVVSSEGRDDVVTSQEQVDDLLESLGF